MQDHKIKAILLLSIIVNTAAFLPVMASSSLAQTQRSSLATEDRAAVRKAIFDVLQTIKQGGVVGLATEVDDCPERNRRPRRATSPVYCLALNLAAMRHVEEVEEAMNWPSSPQFTIDAVMRRAGPLLDNTLPPPEARQNAFRHIAIGVFAAVNDEVSAQYPAIARQELRSR